ncbi:MAG TPA: ADP-ribosylglycohydrolase family protein [Candidatus Limnocylindrales bacterium]|nr:ADP-ribosylglycohydrolase family protein [Candidatus Limnocylindrales bacterium]
MADRARAQIALRGLALGDAFGETWFFKPAEFVEQALAQRWVPAGPWFWTDDTAMALSLVQVLHHYGRVDQQTLADRFAAAYAADPHRNYGASMHEVLSRIRVGEPWAPVVAGQFGGVGSWGNGAAMRVAPLGVWFAGDLDTVVGEAIRSAAVTHAHPQAAAGAVAVAVAAALAVQGIAGHALLEAVAQRTPDGAVRQGLDRAARLGLRASPYAAAAVLGCGQQISAMDTVPFALWCAARHLDDLVEALWTAVAPGGDIDTICAMVGGVVSAASGLDTVPAQWWAECEPLPAWVNDLQASP